jgi:hypothetical protein
MRNERWIVKTMQKSLNVRLARSNSSTDQVLTISRSVYTAFHPLDQLIAQALERIGKVRIIDDEGQEGPGDSFDT